MSRPQAPIVRIAFAYDCQRLVTPQGGKILNVYIARWDADGKNHTRLVGSIILYGEEWEHFRRIGQGAPVSVAFLHDGVDMATGTVVDFKGLADNPSDAKTPE